MCDFVYEGCVDFVLEVCFIFVLGEMWFLVDDDLIG